MTTSHLQVVRASPGLVWRAHEGRDVVGGARAFLRPDNRWFIWFDSGRDDSYAPLLAAVADNTGNDLHASADEDDDGTLALLARLGFTVSRRESNYLIPTDPRTTGLRQTEASGELVFISARDAYEDQLRLLDDALRQDVPGTSGWRWDPGDFREETFDSPSFDPATYLVAVDPASGEYAGLVRVWNDPGRPRLGLIGVKRLYRRRGLARALLGRAFRVLHERGKEEVTAEVDDSNAASATLIATLGARRSGGAVELIRRRLSFSTHAELIALRIGP